MPVTRCPTCGGTLDDATRSCASCGARAATATGPPTATAPTSGGLPPPGARSDVFPRDFGHFRLRREIGHGGMGVVYEAEDTKLLRRVALKTLFPLERGERSRERFLREARIAGALDHPNLVPVHDYGAIEGVAYYTMPLVQGISLEEAIPFLHGRGAGDRPAHLRVPEDDADRVRLVVRWFEGALAGLQRAHDLGIVHRDIKPSNLILDASTGQLRLTDFGVARARHLTGLTQQGTLVGTIGYMSPEQVQRDLDAIGPASDIYSMGVTLYRALVDDLPYSAEVAGSYLERIVSAPLELQRVGVPALPRDLLTILEKAMEKSPGRRYPSARAFAEDLGRFVRYEPIGARPVGPVGRLARWAQRKPATAALSAILIVAALTVGVLVRVQQRSSRILRAQRVEAQTVEGQYASLAGDHAGALRLFDRAIATNPRHFEARIGRALALYDLLSDENDPGRIERALEDLRVAGSIRPDLSSVHLLRAHLLRRRGDEAGALEEKGIADALPPRVALDYRLRGDIAFREGDCPAAVPLFTEAIEIDPQSFWAILQRGRCHLRAGDLVRARIDYEVATHLFPDHAYPHNNLGNVLREQGETGEALAEFRRALALDPGNATIHFNYGETLRLAGNVREAEESFRRALEIDPLLINARNNLGVILLDSGLEGEAIREFGEAVRNETSREKPDAAELAIAHTNLCDLFIARGDAAAAAEPCLRAVETAPDNPISHYNLALYRMLTGDPAAALDALERDVALGDTDADYLLADASFAPLRSHPRFRALVERMRAAAR